MPDDDDRDLFERAIDEMSSDELYRGKFGDGRDAATPSPRNPEDEFDAEELARLRDERLMQSAFAGVERIERSKYHRPEPPPRPEPSEAAPPEAPKDEEPPPPPPEPPLAELAEANDRLNLRGIAVHKAIGKLALFVDLAAKDARPVVGVVTGDDDELRQAVLSWFRGPGAVYVRRLEVSDPDGETRIYAALRRGEP